MLQEIQLSEEGQSGHVSRVDLSCSNQGNTCSVKSDQITPCFSSPQTTSQCLGRFLCEIGEKEVNLLTKTIELTKKTRQGICAQGAVIETTD